MCPFIVVKRIRDTWLLARVAVESVLVAKCVEYLLQQLENAWLWKAFSRVTTVNKRPEHMLHGR